MSRRKPEFQAIDVASWPAVAYTEFDHEARRAFEVRMQALIPSESETVLRFRRGSRVFQMNAQRRYHCILPTHRPPCSG